jgi:hypothetical protein
VTTLPYGRDETSRSSRPCRPEATDDVSHDHIALEQDKVWIMMEAYLLRVRSNTLRDVGEVCKSFFCQEAKLSGAGWIFGRKHGRILDVLPSSLVAL